MAVMSGYGKLSEFLSSRPETHVFRKFASLNVESLLQMQAELLGLGLTIDEVRKDPDLNGFDSSWLDGSNAVANELQSRVRTVLNQYCKTVGAVCTTVTDSVADEALVQTARINSLDRVQTSSFNLMQRWYDEESGGNNFLHGIEASIFREGDCTDMVCLSQSKDDPIAKLIAERVLPVYDRFVGRWFHKSMSAEVFADAREYRMCWMVWIANLLCMVLSAVIPALSILILYNVNSILGRLVAIVVMSLVFSLIMTVVAQRKADIFMSTTAFAAVLVVFVGSSPGIGQS